MDPILVPFTEAVEDVMATGEHAEATELRLDVESALRALEAQGHSEATAVVRLFYGLGTELGAHTTAEIAQALRLAVQVVVRRLHEGERLVGEVLGYGREGVAA